MYYLLYYCCITNLEESVWFFFQIVVFTTSNMMFYKEGVLICFQESWIFLWHSILRKRKLACARLLISVISFLVYSLMQQIMSKWSSLITFAIQHFFFNFM